MHTQDLRDNERDRRQYLFNKRGWFKRWHWQVALSRSRFSENVLRCVLDLGGSDDPCEVQLSLALLGAAVYLTFHKLLPKRWAIGWYQRGEVKNPMWHEDSMGRSWGFYIHDDAFVWLWRNSVACGGSDKKKYGYSKHFYFPWSYGSSIRNQVLTADGKWVDSKYEARTKAFRALRKQKPDVGYFDLKDEDFPDHAEWHEAPYSYQLKGGENQQRVAKFYVSEQEWRWILFHRLPFPFGPKKVHRCISVEFSGEVGERTGSWKGGTIGCSYEMKPGETPLQTLRRMEVEREF